MVHGQQAYHVNTNKTKYSLFHRMHKPVTDSLFSLYLNNVSVEKVASTLFLGIVIDECLTWKLHISNVLVRISKFISIFIECAKYLRVRLSWCCIIHFCILTWPTATLYGVVGLNYDGRGISELRIRIADIRMNFDIRIRIRNISCGCQADIANNKRIIFSYS